MRCTRTSRELRSGTVAGESLCLDAVEICDTRNCCKCCCSDRTEQLPIEARELQLRLKESQTQLHLLQRRYDALASQSDAQTQRHLDYEEQIHGYASVSVCPRMSTPCVQLCFDLVLAPRVAVVSC